MKNKNPIFPIFLLFILTILGGCSTLEPYLTTTTEQGEVTPNQETVESIGLIGTTAENLGVPYAGLAGDFAFLISTGAALFIEAKRRKQKKELEPSKSNEIPSMTGKPS